MHAVAYLLYVASFSTLICRCSRIDAASGHGLCYKAHHETILKGRQVLNSSFSQSWDARITETILELTIAP